MRVLYKVDGAATVFVREASLPRFVPSISSPPLYSVQVNTNWENDWEGRYSAGEMLLCYKSPTRKLPHF